MLFLGLSALRPGLGLWGALGLHDLALNLLTYAKAAAAGTTIFCLVSTAATSRVSRSFGVFSSLLQPPSHGRSAVVPSRPMALIQVCCGSFAQQTVSHKLSKHQERRSCQWCIEGHRVLTFSRRASSSSWAVTCLGFLGALTGLASLGVVAFLGFLASSSCF